MVYKNYSNSFIIIIGILLLNLMPSPAMSGTDALLNGRTVVLDTEGMIVPWNHPLPRYSYMGIVNLTIEFMRNDVQQHQGYPIFYSYSEYGRNPPHAPLDWFSNPSDVLAGFIHSYVQDHYAFTGDTGMKLLTIAFADYMIEHGSTGTGIGWAWEGVPYQLDFGGVLPPRASVVGGSVMPHLIGKLGRYYVWLYKATLDTSYRDAALRCADALAANIRTPTSEVSPWPWRVMPDTDAVYLGDQVYCADVIDPIALFDELAGLGYTGGGAYPAARTTAWNWLYSESGPIQTGNWAHFFEDTFYVAGNHCQINIGETARYILEHPEYDPQWQQTVTNLIAAMETMFGEMQYGAMVMNEQIIYYFPMISHTARYASVCARFYEMTGDAVYREKAMRSYNWSTYGSWVGKDRVFTEIMDQEFGWFTDCHGDFVQHFFEGMASIPEWAPQGRNGILRTTSVIQTVQYQRDSLSYTVYDPEGTDVIILEARPQSVLCGGVPLPEVPDLSTPGWTWTPQTWGGVCRIHHVDSGQIDIHWIALPVLQPGALLVLLAAVSVILFRLRRR